MKVYPHHLQRFLPNLSWDLETLATNLSMIGHESEVVDDALEVKIFPNRGDVLSLRGLTFDLAALYPEVGEWRDVTYADLPSPTQFFDLEITKSARPHVLADHLLKIEGYTPTKSPKEVVELLQPLGLQSKDLLIDLTNVVAYEVGVPLHTFDFDKVAAGMTIDHSKADESFVALNKKSVILPAGALIARITNGEVADLLGVMGGDNSSINNTTSTVLLQSAVFDPKIIRYNSKVSGIATEASYRYQRGVDPQLVTRAIARFVYLLKQSLPSVEVSAYQAYDNAPAPKSIPVSAQYMTDLLGTEIATKNIQSLERLGYVVAEDEVTAPSWRFDVALPADVAEDIARLIGLNNIQPKQLQKTKRSVGGSFEAVLGLKHQLVNTGFTETLTYSFTKDGPVTLQNPRTPEQRALRSSLREGILRTLAKNPFLPKSFFFEIGAVFTPTEEQHLGIVVAGLKEKQLAPVQEQLSRILGTTAEFSAVAPEELANYDVKQTRVYIIELPLSALTLPNYTPRGNPLPAYRQISKYPPVIRDVTLVVDSSASQEVIKESLLHNELILFVELVDEYESSEQLGEGKVALTYRIFLQNLQRSLTDEEAASALKAVLLTLSDKVKFEQR